MRQVLIFFVKYFLFWFLYFIILRFLFLVWNHPETMGLDFGEWIRIFWFGRKMDFSVAAYFSIIPGLFLAIRYFLKNDFVILSLRIYTFALLLIITILGFIDLVLYPHWGTRLGILFIRAVSDPVGVTSTLRWWQFLFGALVCFLWAFLWYKVYCRLVENPLKNDINGPFWLSSLVVLLITASLIIPVRGGIGHSPLNHSGVAFSENYYSNQAAFNYFWCFAHDLIENSDTKNPAVYMDENLSNKLVSHRFIQPDTIDYPKFLNINKDNPPNVILVILESFSNKLIGSLGGIPDLTPGLNKLCYEGITFTGFFATGNRSDKGLSGIMAAYPALLNTSLLNQMEKARNLDFLPRYFNSKGYSAAFYYGGDINFYNTRLLLIQAGVTNLVSKNDFPSKIRNMSKWGVPDEFLYNRFFDDLSVAQQPFLRMVYTISSHDPFDVPFKRIHGIGMRNRYLNSVAYADSCLYDFVGKLKNSPIWDNTLLIITSDHGSVEPGPTTPMDPESYRIPMIWTGGVVDTTLFVSNISMQTDLAFTLAKQMGWETILSPYSKNIFGSRQYAFYLTETGWGYQEPDISFFFDRYTHDITWFKGEKLPQADGILVNAKAYIQYLHTDFLNR